MATETTKPAKPPSLGGPLSLIVFGALVLFGSWAAGFDAAHYRKLDESGMRVNADVVGTRTFNTGHGSTRSPVFVAKVKFTASGGKVVSGEATIDEELFQKLEKETNAKIRLVYLAEEPDSFRYEELNAQEAGEARTVSWVMRIIGGLCVFGGLYTAVGYFRRRGAGSTAAG